MALESLGVKAEDNTGGDGSTVDASAAGDIDGDGTVEANAAQDDVGAGGDGAYRRLIMMTIFSSLSHFIYGYDRTIIASCIILIREELNLTTLWHQFFVGGVYIAGLVTSLVTGLLADFFGRWIVITFSSVVYLISAVVMATARNRPQILVSRILVGISIGLTSMTVPVYLSESSPARIRGQITVVPSLMAILGQVIASFVGAPFSTIDNSWRYMIGLGSIAALIQLVGFSFLPRSPRWLVMKGRFEEARKVLKSLRSSKDNFEAELDEIKVTTALNANKRGIVQIFKTATVRRALLLGVLLHVSQRLTGVTAILSYSITILVKSGVSDKTTAMWYWAAIMGTSTIGAFLGLWLVDRVGRRPLVLSSLVGHTLSLFMVAVIFNLIHVRGPSVQMPSADQECQAETCGLCTSRRHCGLCFTGEVGSEQDTSCVKVDPHSFYKASLSGLCSNTTLLEEGAVTFAYGWCPYVNAWVILLGLTFFFFAFNLGMSSMPWTISSETFPGWARSEANTIALAANLGTSMITNLTFLSLSEDIFTHGVFYLFMSFTAVFTLVFVFILPETKGISLEDMEKLFSKPLGTGVLDKAPRVHPDAGRT